MKREQERKRLGEAERERVRERHPRPEDFDEGKDQGVFAKKGLDRTITNYCQRGISEFEVLEVG